MSQPVADRPPDLDGVTWVESTCPTCRSTWWLGRDDESPADLSIDAMAGLLGECADCRDPSPEPRLHAHVAVRPNRAARRAARFNRRPL